MWNKSFWQIATTYLASSSSKEAHFILAELIERQQPDTERKAIKLLDVSDQYKLDDQRKTICRVMATKRFKQNRFGNALSWVLLSRDGERLSQLSSSRILDDYLSTGTLDEIESIVEKLDPNFAFSDKLAFIEKYREIQLYKKNGNIQNSALLTLKLLTSPTSNSHLNFWPRLLLDILPVFTKQNNFSMQDIFQFMHCLQEIYLSPRKSQILEQSNITSKDLNSIQLELTLALSNSMLTGQ